VETKTVVVTNPSQADAVAKRKNPKNIIMLIFIIVMVTVTAVVMVVNMWSVDAIRFMMQTLSANPMFRVTSTQTEHTAPKLCTSNAIIWILNPNIK